MAAVKGEAEQPQAITMRTVRREGKSEGITLRVMDWKDSTRDIREEFHKHFMEKYPEVTEIEYTTLTQDQFRDTILAAIRTNEAPDIFYGASRL